jgi:hypothetical protein
LSIPQRRVVIYHSVAHAPLPSLINTLSPPPPLTHTLVTNNTTAAPSPWRWTASTQQ